jgi:hypothetical protein
VDVSRIPNKERAIAAEFVGHTVVTAVGGEPVDIWDVDIKSLA